MINEKKCYNSTVCTQYLSVKLNFECFLFCFSKIQQLQKEKELTEEDEVRLKNDLKSLK